MLITSRQSWKSCEMSAHGNMVTKKFPQKCMSFDKKVKNRKRRIFPFLAGKVYIENLKKSNLLPKCPFMQKSANLLHCHLQALACL